MDDTTSGYKKEEGTMVIPDRISTPKSRWERIKEIEESKKEINKKKAVQSFAKAHSKRRKKK